MCRNGHDLSLLGVSTAPSTPGRCIACRRIRNSRSVRRYRSTPKGHANKRANNARWIVTIKGQRARQRAELQYRIRQKEARVAELEGMLNAYT